MEQAEPIAFGPLSHYQKLIGEAPLPPFTGAQTCGSGYRTPDHFHRYAEYLFIIEGVMEAWLVGREDEVLRSNAGDIIALPPDTPRAFRNPEPGERRLLGNRANPERIVHRSDAAG